MIDYINTTKAKHIITLEDPIEYVHTHKKSIINQREVGSDTQSFANGLRAALTTRSRCYSCWRNARFRNNFDCDYCCRNRSLSDGNTSYIVVLLLQLIGLSMYFHHISKVKFVFNLQMCCKELFLNDYLYENDAKGRVAATEILVQTPSVANLIRNEKVHQITKCHANESSTWNAHFRIIHSTIIDYRQDFA